MKKLLLALPLILGASSLEIEDLRTDLYSKSGANVLKKVELSLEFKGENLDSKKNQIIDSVNTVISGFFYEDIFTESGKNNFKRTLEKFMEKKYKLKVDEIYILSLSGVEKFDIEEFKKFLESSEAKEKNTGKELKKILNNIEVPEVDEVKTPSVPQLPQKLFGNDEENSNDTDIKPENLNIPKITPDIEEKIKRDLIQNQNLSNQKNEPLEQNASQTGTTLENSQNQSQENSQTTAPLKPNSEQNQSSKEISGDESEISL